MILTPVCRHIARRAGFVAAPKDDRWHRTPTALFGGIAIAATTIGLGVAVGPDIRLWTLLAGGAAMALFGVFDDVLTVKPSTKLVMQISLASMLVFLDYRLGWTDSLVLDAMLTLLWVVGITNSFNLLDNMDGLCAGIALIAGTFLLGTLYAHTGVSPISMYLAVLLGATAGFLVYNIHPATIFMGDTGSLFLGFNLAALTLLATSIGTRSGTVRRVVGRGRSSPAFVDSDFRHDACHSDAHSLGQTPFARRPGSQFSPIGGHRPSGIDCCCDIVGSGHRRRRPRDSYPSGGENWFGIVALTFVLAMIIFAVYLAKIRVYEDAPSANAGKSPRWLWTSCTSGEWLKCCWISA